MGQNPVLIVKAPILDASSKYGANLNSRFSLLVSVPPRCCWCFWVNLVFRFILCAPPPPPVAAGAGGAGAAAAAAAAGAGAAAGGARAGGAGAGAAAGGARAGGAGGAGGAGAGANLNSRFGFCAPAFLLVLLGKFGFSF